MFSGVKSWFSNYSFKHPWESVVYAASYKYPNSFNPNVKHIDIISRKIDESTGIMFTHKLLTTEWPMFGNIGSLYASEYTAIDPKNKRMVLVSINHSVSSILTAKEKLEYIQDPDSNEWTLMNQSTTIKAFPGFLDRIINVYKSNAMKGRKAIEWVIENRLPLLPSIPECHEKVTAQPIQQRENNLDKLRSKIETNWDDISRDVSKAKEEIVNSGVLFARMCTSALVDDIYFYV